MTPNKKMIVIRYITLKIQNGDYKVGEQIPSASFIAIKFNISVLTVRQAINEMISKGYLKSEERKGYYVVDSVLNSKFHVLKNLISSNDLTWSSSIVNEKKAIIMNNKNLDSNEYIRLNIVCCKEEERVKETSNFLKRFIWENYLLAHGESSYKGVDVIKVLTFSGVIISHYHTDIIGNISRDNQWILDIINGNDESIYEVTRYYDEYGEEILFSVSKILMKYFQLDFKNAPYE